MNKDSRHASSSTYLHDVVAIAEADHKGILQAIEQHKTSRQDESNEFLHSLDRVLVENDDDDKSREKPKDQRNTSKTAAQRSVDAKLALKHADAILRIYQEACRAIVASTESLTTSGEDGNSGTSFRKIRDSDREHLSEVLRAGMRVVGGYGMQTTGDGEKQNDDVAAQARAAFGLIDSLEKGGKFANEKLLLQSVRKGVRKMTDGLSLMEESM